MKNKALQILEIDNRDSLEGVGWFELFGEGLSTKTYARWASIEEEAVELREKEVEEDVFEAGEEVEATETAVLADEGTWDHYCRNKECWVRGSKDYPCDFCGEEYKDLTNTWAHYCSNKGHLVYQSTNKPCEWCGKTDI